MKIAITGGIGSGKSYVCRLLADRGITVYDCDAAAKRLMHTSEALQHSLRQLVGADVYDGTQLQKAVLASYIRAILFDSQFDRRVSFDRVVCVSAPLEVRLARVMSRDGIGRAKALEWVGRQMSQDEVERRSDFVIVNDGSADLDSQLTQLLSAVAL